MGLGISHLIQHIGGPFLITVEIALQQIGAEEEPENGKHDKKFYKDDAPEFPPPGHP